MVELTPQLFLTMWAAGIAAAAAAVALWRVVGPGFAWLAGAVTLMFGVLGAAAGGGAAAWVGAAAAAFATVAGRRPQPAAAFFAVAAVAFTVAAAPDGGGPVLAATGALALGGVTGEMMLGHWYLIDPRLPRWALRRLAVAGMVGVGADALDVTARGGLDFDADAVVTAAFLVLAAATLILLVAVWFSLAQPSYPGVMAATGLSYLAMITVIGAVVAGRSLLDEGGSILAFTLLPP